MFNSSVLDVAMGLIFVYLILGLMCTTVNEWIAQLFKMRSQVLKTGIQALLNTVPAKVGAPARDLAAEFYGHPMVRSLSKQGGDPSYLPARTFSLALIDILGGKVAPPPVALQPVALQTGPALASQSSPVDDPLVRVKASIEALPEGDVQKSLLLLLSSADNRLVTFQQHLETWFEDAMDRVSGWYKKRSQVITVVVAAVITIFANADSIGIARKLFVNPTLREAIVQEAGARKAQATNPSQNVAPDQLLSGLTPQEKADLGELTGWSAEFKTFHGMKAQHDDKTPKEIEDAKADDTFPGLNLISYVFFPWVWAIAPAHLFGWLLTAVAASLGAPFWFDTLNRFMNIRAAGTSPNEKGQDRSKV
jgi:hypothetical protein